MSEHDPNLENEYLEDEPDIQQQLEELAAVSQGFLKREVTFWAVRWVIGFAIIAAIVHYYPDWSWLWLAGALVATITLSTLILANHFLKRKVAQTHDKISQAKTELEQMPNEENNDAM